MTISLQHLFTSLISHRSKPRDLSFRLTARPVASSFTTDALVSAPTLDQLEELGRAMCKPRQVDSTDTQNSDTAPPAGMTNLLLGGEPFQEFDWIPRLPNGDRYGYAVMEQRLWMRPGPITLDTPIQSFRASLQVGEKVGRAIAWCYNTDTGEPLVASEAIDLCLNLTQRRAMAIPAESRSEADPDFHPELAPR